MAVPHTSTDLFDLYAEQGDSSKPLIVYVHGGAWRAESKKLHAPLAARIRELAHFPVAVLDYRLSLAENDFLKHPVHAEDVLHGLESLVNWSVAGDAPFDPTRLYLIGHSAGGHILTSLFLDSKIEEIKPSETLLQAVQGIGIASGIYDLDALLAKFPSYDFIAQAFTSPYGPWNTTTYSLYPTMRRTRWHVIHSRGDSLVDLGQSDAMYAHLRKLYTEKDSLNQNLITKDYDTLTTEHDYVCEPVFAHFVVDWVKKDLSL